MSAAVPRILLVDDEPSLVDSIRALLRGRFVACTAHSGAEALDVLAREEPFAVVMSDMRMPGMSGAALLAQVRTLAPNTVRVLLTGHADTDTAAAAINDGQIFRFLTKPCPPEMLLSQLHAAVEQHRLITAEKELLEKTLRGSVKTLTSLLALAAPAAFGRAGRLEAHVRAMCDLLGLEGRWHLEVAAMLSQIGCITLPPAVMEKHYFGHPLSPVEDAMVERLPGLACDLIGPIPRLEPVREVLANMNRRFYDSGTGDPPSMGACLLKIAQDHDVLEARGLSIPDVLATLCGRRQVYDPQLLRLWCQRLAAPTNLETIKEVRLAELRTGMVLVEDVRTRAGLLLIARGQETTPEVLGRLRNFGASAGLVEPLRVRMTTP